MTSRKRVQKVLTEPVALHGGPYGGQVAKLTVSAREQTLTFTAKGQTGSYRKCVWVPQ